MNTITSVVNSVKSFLGIKVPFDFRNHPGYEEFLILHSSHISKYLWQASDEVFEKFMSESYYAK